MFRVNSKLPLDFLSQVFLLLLLLFLLVVVVVVVILTMLVVIVTSIVTLAVSGIQPLHKTECIAMALVSIPSIGK